MIQSLDDPAIYYWAKSTVVMPDWHHPFKCIQCYSQWLLCFVRLSKQCPARVDGVMGDNVAIVHSRTLMQLWESALTQLMQNETFREMCSGGMDGGRMESKTTPVSWLSLSEDSLEDDLPAPITSSSTSPPKSMTSLPWIFFSERVPFTPLPC